MNKKEITITNKLGLHARAAAKFVKAASNFQCEISLRADHKEVNGKSIMDIMMLAAGKGAVIEIKTIGADENAAMETLAALVNNKFGEDE